MAKYTPPATVCRQAVHRDAAARFGGSDNLIVQDTRGVVGEGCRACVDVRANRKCWNWKRLVVDITGVEALASSDVSSPSRRRSRRAAKGGSPACNMHTFG